MDVTCLDGISIDDFPFLMFDDIVVIEQTEEEVTQSGLILTGDYKNFQGGKVVAVGPGRTYAFYMDASGQTMAGKHVPNAVKVGDWVLFGKYASGGEPIEIGGKKYIMARVGDLGGKSKNGEPIKVRLANRE